MFYQLKQIVWLTLVSGVFLAVIVLSSSRTQAMSSVTPTATQLNASSAPNEGDSTKGSATILGEARTIYIWSQTVFVKQEVIESALLKRDDYRRSGLLITKDKNAADLVLTVRRANFTTEYPYDVVDQKTRLVVAGGKVNSLFGTAAGKIAKGFMKQIQQARSGAIGRP